MFATAAVAIQAFGQLASTTRLYVLIAADVAAGPGARRRRDRRADRWALSLFYLVRRMVLAFSFFASTLFTDG
jgi:hypothetical protein